MVSHPIYELFNLFSNCFVILQQNISITAAYVSYTNLILLLVDILMYDTGYMNMNLFTYLILYCKYLQKVNIAKVSQ